MRRLLAAIAAACLVAGVVWLTAPASWPPITVDGPAAAWPRDEISDGKRVSRFLELVYARHLVRYYESLIAARAPRGGGSCDPGGVDYGPGGYDGRYNSPAPAWVIDQEANGNYARRNCSSGACGKYQVLPSTWDGYGGYSSACDAPPEVQDAWAQEACDSAGTQPWGRSGSC